MIQLEHYLLLSAILFGIGVYGLVVKRNALRMLMSIEILTNAATLNFMVFAQLANLSDQVIVLFVIAVAAAHAAIGLALITLMSRTANTIDVMDMDELRR
jgi:NADH:ubiquinone oxidoreductase subunit K